MENECQFCGDLATQCVGAKGIPWAYMVCYREVCVEQAHESIEEVLAVLSIPTPSPSPSNQEEGAQSNG